MTYIRGEAGIKEGHKFENVIMRDHGLFEYLFNTCPSGLEGNKGESSHNVERYEDASWRRRRG